MKKCLIGCALFGLVGLGCGDEMILGVQCPSGEQQQQIRYRSNEVAVAHHCESELQVRYCLDGNWDRWSGSFQFESCQTTCLFKDSQLEAVIRETTNIFEGELYGEDLVTLTRLEAPNRGIRDLAGLQCWSTLESVDLSNPWPEQESAPNQIVDLRPLAQHKQLKTLDLRHNQIVDVGSLVDHPGIGEGDRINLVGNPLDCQDDAQILLINKLLGAGVMLNSDCH